MKKMKIDKKEKRRTRKKNKRRTKKGENVVIGRTEIIKRRKR